MLLWIDGFDNYGTSGNTTPNGVMARKYVASNDFAIVAGRSGGNAIDLSANGIAYYFQSKSLTVIDTVVIGFAAKFDVIPAGYTFFATYDGAQRNLKFVLLNTGEIQVNNDGGTLIGTTSGAGISTATWYYIEAKVKTNNSTGTVEIHVNGSSVLSVTGKDTRVGAHDYSDGFKINSIAGTHLIVDDLYFLDTSGTRNNDFLGSNTYVSTLRVNGDGDTNTWTGSAGAAHYTYVDENPCNDDMDYVTTSDSTKTELYQYDNLSSANSIFGIRINTDCRLTSAGSVSVITAGLSGPTGGDDLGQTVTSTTYTTIGRIVETDPNPNSTVPWSADDLSAAQWGVKIGSNVELRVTRQYVEVLYSTTAVDSAIEAPTIQVTI